MLLTCGVGEDSWESLGLQGDQTGKSERKSDFPEYSLERLMLKLQYFGHLMQKQLTHWKRPWCWERLRAGGELDNRGWDGWMATPTQWTWVWASFGSWWWTRKPGMLHSKGLQRVGHDWVAELNWTLSVIYIFLGTLAFRYVVCKLFYTSKYFILQMQLSFS